MSLIKDILRSPIHDMSWLRRYGGLPFHKPESDAEHCFRAACIAMFALDEMGMEDKIPTAVTAIMVHDLEEVVAGTDFKGPFKKLNGLKEPLDKAASRALHERIDKNSALSYYWKLTRTDPLIVELASFCDSVCVICKAILEIHMGNSLVAWIPGKELKSLSEKSVGGNRFARRYYNEIKEDVEKIMDDDPVRGILNLFPPSKQGLYGDQFEMPERKDKTEIEGEVTVGPEKDNA